MDVNPDVGYCILHDTKQEESDRLMTKVTYCEGELCLTRLA